MTLPDINLHLDTVVETILERLERAGYAQWPSEASRPLSHAFISNEILQFYNTRIASTPMLDTTLSCDVPFDTGMAALESFLNERDVWRSVAHPERALSRRMYDKGIAVTLEWMNNGKKVSVTITTP